MEGRDAIIGTQRVTEKQHQNEDSKIMQQTIQKQADNGQKDKLEELTKLYRSQNINKNGKTKKTN